jgi:drug/metabolite transporter (DMT)-like permease
MVMLGLTMIGIAYPTWFACLKRLPASRVSVYVYMTPVFAVILSLLILEERFSWLFLLGGALVLGGIALASPAGRTRSSRAARA